MLKPQRLQKPQGRGADHVTQTRANQPVPQETARIAKAAFPKGSTFIRMRDELGTLYSDEAFAALFPPDDQPALAPWRPAFVTIMQFVEGLSDRQAADAVRGRLDWKYALVRRAAHDDIPGATRKNEKGGS
jgi:transposase